MGGRSGLGGRSGCLSGARVSAPGKEVLSDGDEDEGGDDVDSSMGREETLSPYGIRLRVASFSAVFFTPSTDFLSRPI
ncbi:hypothetical protein SUGI_0297800 [Cryptomeria japonica]|nr:hypothetical protein SUGI_0297800 [Cryptomeria japonica]